LRGDALARHVAGRIAPQTQTLLISANRNLDAYAALGAPFGARVVSDASDDFPGPLAGILAGLRTARTELLLCVPCDAPNVPFDLAQRLAGALDAAHADIATVVTRDEKGHSSLHPVFALLRTTLADDLAAFLARGERKVRTWYARHINAEVDFADEHAFYNANSLPDLDELEHAPAGSGAVGRES
jgi:molybdopterin-guanine dinucleotide biosynthesis protein A